VSFIGLAAADVSWPFQCRSVVQGFLAVKSGPLWPSDNASPGSVVTAKRRRAVTRKTNGPLTCSCIHWRLHGRRNDNANVSVSGQDKRGEKCRTTPGEVRWTGTHPRNRSKRLYYMGVVQTIRQRQPATSYGKSQLKQQAQLLLR